MVKQKKYSLSGKILGEMEIHDSLVNAEANGQMIKDYIVALRNNARQWSANTKGRSEVNHSTQKPHPQKGQGRARQGRLSSPQYKGGGRVHTPKPKFDQHVRINRKERRAALRFLISEKIRENKLHIIEDTSAITEPKTKTLASLLKHLQVTGRALFLAESSFLDLGNDESVFRINVPSTRHDSFTKSLRNLPKTQFNLASNVNGFDLVRAQHLIVTESGLNELQEMLAKE